MADNARNPIQPSWGRRLFGIEGLRACAALAVLIGHVVGKLGGDVLTGWPERFVGFTGHGLTLFFALSGFLLFRPFASSLINRTPAPDVKRYALNRALRIFPGYIVILVLVSFVLGAANTQAPTIGDSDFSRTDDTIGYLVDPLKFISSLFMVQTFFPLTNRTGIGVSWSLSVELIFYILLPLLALGAVWMSRRLRNRIVAALLPAAALLILGITGKLWSAYTLNNATPDDRFGLQWGDNWVAVLHRSIFVHADLFAYGMVAAVVVVLAQSGKLGERTIAALRIGSGVVALGLAAAVLYRHVPPFDDTLVGVACGALLLLVCLPAPNRSHALLARALEWTPLRLTGLASYSVYLWHVPVLWLLVHQGWVFGPTIAGLLGNIVLVAAVTLALSTITYRYVEVPGLRLKDRAASRRALRPAASS